MENPEYKRLFENYKISELFGRYINHEMILDPLKKFGENAEVEEIGKSLNGLPISFIKIGKGAKRILMWSQMHGNESTTTKSLFDFCNTLLHSEGDSIKKIDSHCTIGIIPMLNPDGAKAYTRNNANDIDLNRDAIDLSQPESRVLRNCFESFKPHYCFNLHGQRTIFSAGKKPKSATVSFLAPTQDKLRSITSNRKDAMAIIVAITKLLQDIIPGSIGVYDDSYNINCVGDYFQAQGIPTVLIEAGHYPHDYNREYVRYLIFICLLEAAYSISTSDYKNQDATGYANIPQNEKLFFDVMLRNATLDIGSDKTTDLAFQFQEILDKGKIIFTPKLEKISRLDEFFGHYEIDARKNIVSGVDGEELKIGYLNDFVLLKNEKTSLKAEKSSFS